uniref:hypothetical protein n=1 Tax=Acetatifactor sp. TaxID=1872090 RepID=UPI00405760EE
MSKKIVVSFPGGRTGAEIPLLYFGAKYFENEGYEKVFVKNHLASEDCTIEEIYEDAKTTLASINFGEYEQIVFIGKSMGTVVACKLKEELGIPAELVLFTPLQETLPYIRKDNQILLVAAGDKDRYLDSCILQEVCAKENVPCHIEEGVGHRMEVIGDIDRDIEVLGAVISKLKRK